MRPAAIIFDMDGTLLDTEAVGQRATKATIASMGFDASDAVCLSLIGLPDIEGTEILRRHLGSAFSKATFLARFAAERHSVEAQVALKPGAREIVAALRADAARSRSPPRPTDRARSDCSPSPACADCSPSW